MSKRLNNKHTNKTGQAQPQNDSVNKRFLPKGGRADSEISPARTDWHSGVAANRGSFLVRRYRMPSAPSARFEERPSCERVEKLIGP